MDNESFNRWLIELWAQEHNNENMVTFCHILTEKKYKAYAGRAHKEDVLFKNINAILN